MNNPNPFLAEVEAVLGGPNSLRGHSPAQMIEQWEQLMDWCKDGYQWDVSEYLNELSVRDKLEHLLTAKRLQPYPELQELKSRVAEIDARFKPLLRSDVQLENHEHWWERGVLKRAGEQYATYFRDAHGIQVEVV